ncbi:MAG: serine/threonine protein phosphatase [Geminicoccales bacterium]
MIAAEDLVLAPFEDMQHIHDVPFPCEFKFRQFLITGPPGSGKSTLVGAMRGWPYEGYVDLSVPGWWRIQALTFRPRELHLGAPFKKHRNALSVIDNAWLNDDGRLELDFRRIVIPSTKSWFLGTDWRTRYAFDFVLPPADEIYRNRMARAKSGLFPHDRHVTPDIVDRQVTFYRTIAWYFWISGMHVYLRVAYGGAPMKIIECKRAPRL